MPNDLVKFELGGVAADGRLVILLDDGRCDEIGGSRTVSMKKMEERWERFCLRVMGTPEIRCEITELA